MDILDLGSFIPKVERVEPETSSNSGISNNFRA